MIKQAKKRIWELDFIRGICLLLMVFDHLMMNAEMFVPMWVKATSSTASINFNKFVYDYFHNGLWNIRSTVRPVIVFLFFSLCGLSSSFSRNNFKRGIEVAFVGLILSCGSFAIDEIAGTNFFIHFGVLQMLATCILFWWLVSLICKDKIGRAGVALSLAVILHAFYLALPETSLPADKWYTAILTNNILMNPSVQSSKYGYIFSPGDYFSIMPNISMFLTGAGLSTFLYNKKKTLLPFLEGKWSKPVEFIGRNTLIIFLVHIPIITVIFTFITCIITNNWNIMSLFG